jgi:Rrf2 family protein
MMSQKTKYGLKALIFLAKQEKGTVVQTNDIALKTLVPKKFLEQILLELKRNHIVGSRQGSKGGYYLLQKPEEIRLATIHRYLDGPIALLPCVSLNFYEPCADCEDEHTCKMRLAFIEVRDKTLEAMENITISDMV